MRWWRRRPFAPVVEVHDEHELARAAERDSAARWRARAEETLRSRLSTLSAHCVVDVLVAPWLSRRDPWTFDVGPLPPADVLLAAFRLLREDPPVRVVEDFAAAEPTEVRPFFPPAPAEELHARFARERWRHVAGWRMPSGVDATVHAMTGRRLRALNEVALRRGDPLPVDEVLANARWWPGRQARSQALTDRFSHLYRREEAQRFDPGWLKAADDARGLLYEAIGLPAVSPEAWVLAATDYAVRRAADQQP